MNDPLADLKDIHLPGAISWWPLAPGWWLLILTIVLLIIATSYCYYLWKKRAYRRMALHELEALFANNTTVSDLHYLETVATLIRRTAIAGSTNNQLAHWQGSQWQEYLQQQMPEDQARLIAVSRYQAQHDINRELLTDAARNWIKRHKV